MDYKKTAFLHKYEIGQSIYHVTPESDKGIIKDISYSILNNKVLYNVVFGRRAEDDVWCTEEELSVDRNII